MRNPLAMLAGIALSALAAFGAAAPDIQPRGPLQLTLRRAVEIATSPEGNPRVQLQAELVKQAKAHVGEARSFLLPDIEGYTSILSSVRSLSAQGLTSVSTSSPLVNGLLDSLPPVAGPYHILDIRSTLSVPAFDLSIWDHWRSSRASLRSAKSETVDVNDTVASQVARAYVLALRTDADVDTIQADVELAQAELTQATNQKEAGTGTGIDVTRANVQLADDRQRLLVARNTQTKARLQLLRVMNLRQDTPVDLSDRLSFNPVDEITFDQAFKQAIDNRPDLKSQIEKEDAARLNAASVKVERLPSIIVQADYGTIGPQDVTLHPTRDLFGEVRFPVFDGGRRDYRRAEAYSQYRSEKIRSNDLRDQIELDVRSALDNLKSANEQVQVAEEGLKLADTELKQARRRYAAGVATSLEVSDATDKLHRAQSNRIQALYNHSTARIDLGQALGKTMSMID